MTKWEKQGTDVKSFISELLKYVVHDILTRTPHLDITVFVTQHSWSLNVMVKGRISLTMMLYKHCSTGMPTEKSMGKKKLTISPPQLWLTQITFPVNHSCTFYPLQDTLILQFHYIITHCIREFWKASWDYYYFFILFLLINRILLLCRDQLCNTEWQHYSSDWNIVI